MRLRYRIPVIEKDTGISQGRPSALPLQTLRCSTPLCMRYPLVRYPEHCRDPENRVSKPRFAQHHALHCFLIFAVAASSPKNRVTHYPDFRNKPNCLV